MPKFAANLTIAVYRTAVPGPVRRRCPRGFLKPWSFCFPMSMRPGKLNSACRRTSCSWCCSIPHPATSTPENGGSAAVPGRSAEARQQIQLALEYACQLDCPQVHIMAGVVQPGMDRAACEAVLIDNLRYAAECFARHDKRILIEALNPQTKPGYLYHSQYQTLEMVKRVDRPNVAVAVRSVSRAEGGRQFKPSHYRICRPVSSYSDCLPARPS
ncbi:hydroxypyruvate isomerase [Klebsiella variicola]|uniref:Hydroxypyruvate isomerase n=1 Tax=Klebsiella variicola TaxID=244366 RepID=A0A7H4MJQ8_KLEVA|nr:hydroxypyruvate isomerase [Klebsiella variicola]